MKNNKPRPETPPSRIPWLLKSTLLLVLVVAFLGGVVWAGRWGLDYLRGHDRYAVAFSEIECEPPNGMSKADFLDEVLFESRLPKRLNVLEEDLEKKLREGFSKHHWIAKVDKVEINPPKQIVVKLSHRIPVLAVKVGKGLRAVDGDGVLLYTDAPTVGLPIFDGDAKPPPAKAGTRWGDPNIEAAARKLKK